MALRVAARQVADGSLEYGMGFDEQREDDEPCRNSAASPCCWARPASRCCDGTVLDYVEVAPGATTSSSCRRAEHQGAAAEDPADGAAAAAAAAAVAEPGRCSAEHRQDGAPA